MDLTRTKLYKTIKDPASTASDIWKACNDYTNSKKDINLTDNVTGESYLHVLAGHGGSLCSPSGVTAIYLMASSGLNLDIRDARGETCLHKACRAEGSFRIVVALMRCGVDPLIRNNDGQTAQDVLEAERPEHWRQTLHWLKKYSPGVYHTASQEDGEKRLEKLLKGWCRTHITRSDGSDVDLSTLIAMADGARNLLKQYAATNEFVIAILAGKTPVLNGHSIDDVDVDTKDHMFEDDDYFSREAPKPLLAVAWETGRESSVRAVLTLRPDTSVLYSCSGEKHKAEPLFFHLIKKEDRPSDTITHTILQSADVTARDQRGQSILFKAITNDYSEQFIAALFKYGVDISVRDDRGRTARDHAEHLKKPKYLTVIDDHVIQLAKDCNIDRIQYLVLQGYDYIVGITDHRGFNLTNVIKHHYMTGDKETLLQLIEKIPAIRDHISLMFRATDTGGTDELERLTSPRFSVARDNCGRTILHKAILNKKKEMIKFVVTKYPKIIDMQDSLGRTALHYSHLVTEGTSLHSYLLFKGADPDVKDWAGRRAEDYSISRCGKDEYVRLQRSMKSFSMDVYLTETNFEQSLLRAVRRRDLAEIENLVLGLTDKGDVNRYANVLFQCVDTGRDEIAVYLIRQGMRTDIYKQYENCSPRSSACSTYSCDHTLTSLCARAKQMGCHTVLDAIAGVTPRHRASIEMDGRPIVAGPSTMDQFSLLGLV